MEGKRLQTLSSKCLLKSSKVLIYESVLLLANVTANLSFTNVLPSSEVFFKTQARALQCHHTFPNFHHPVETEQLGGGALRPVAFMGNVSTVQLV